MSTLDVFVVRRIDGMWEAACCAPECGFGVHLVLESETSAPVERAATEHRKEVKKLAEEPAPGAPAARCPACGQPAKETP